MGEKPNILLITTDQQRFDSLGCNGNTVCRTPAIDSLAAEGIRYERAHVQNVLCMPSRSTIVTGQHPGTHGVWSNGVCLPREAPSVAQLLRGNGYTTALIGKIHFETVALNWAEHLQQQGLEPLLTIDLDTTDEMPTVKFVPTDTGQGDHRGFDHLEMCNHFILGHHAQWLEEQAGAADARRWIRASHAEFAAAVGGDDPRANETGAPQSTYSEMPAELHSTNWAVDRTLAWLDGIESDDPFFCWLSFDDPHHPFNPPAEYGRRHDWRDLPLPAARKSTVAARESELRAKPWQYHAYWTGELGEHEGGGSGMPLRGMTDEQLREITALTHGMVELIDDAMQRLLDGLAARGLDQTTHVFFTTDHGELLGDHGLLLKGPFHLDGLLRIPLLWRAPGSTCGVVSDPVGLVDLAPTFCDIAGVPVPDWMEGAPLPVSDGHRQRVLTSFDSGHQAELRLRTIYRDGFVLTSYPAMDEGVGELYDLDEDPHQFVNLWNDPERQGLKADLLDDLRHHVVEDPRQERLPRWSQA